MAAVTICSDFGAQESKICHCFHFLPSYLSWRNGTKCHDLSFLNVDFKQVFSLSLFICIKRIFSSSLLSAIRVVSSAYVRLLIFLPAILIPACPSSSPAFLMMYSADKLNKQVEWCYEDLQDLLELTLEKGVLFIIGDWNAKVGIQETTGVTGIFGLGVQNKAGQMLI